MFIKPMSVNEAYRGRRFKTEKYKAYEQEVLLRLPKLDLPEPPFTLMFEFGFSNSRADYDNPVKPYQDILQRAYGFDDKLIQQGIQRKVLVSKGEEYVKFRILPLIDLGVLFEIGEDQTLKVV